MRITINYALCTDGDYILNNPEEFGCIGQNVTKNDISYDYIGSKKFENENADHCKINARFFLQKFLCDGLRVSYTHSYLLKEFYEIIDALIDIIRDFENGMVKIRKHIYGNYDGTDFEIIIQE